MVFVSITRLRLRSPWFLPGFALYTLRSLRQVKKAPGFRGGSTLPDRALAFWTMTVWDSEASMRQYMISGSHKSAMPHLIHWCDEASVVHWEQPEDDLPGWELADRRMRESGRASKVNHPSAAHADLSYLPPRIGTAGPIKPSRPSSTTPAGRRI